MSALKDPRRHRELQQLVQKLGLIDTTAIEWSMLDLALTHSTASAIDNYERLEFLGDAVVRLAAAEFLMETASSSAVGELAAIRSALVSDRILAKIAESYGLERYLLMSGGAAGDKAGQQSRLAEAFEAVVGALYLSTHDLTLIRPWLDAHFAAQTAEIRTDPALQNYKAALQEWTQAHHKTLPEYRVTEVGQTHGDPDRFAAEVWLQGQCLGQGTGRSIKLAEQAAAQVAFLLLTQEKR
jgi:ribonuclease-3